MKKCGKKRCEVPRGTISSDRLDERVQAAATPFLYMLATLLIAVGGYFFYSLLYY